MPSTAVVLAVPAVAWFIWDVVGPLRIMNEQWWPVVSYFKREWRKNPQMQTKNLRAFANFLVFAVMAWQLIIDRDDVGVRTPTPRERASVERGMERLINMDMERHTVAMDTLLHKHTLSGR
eukprot:TRINITY_DN7529_c0_g1_i1.p3 TRINITY_DN7529_c0_g1~~TRINITY_DN7529_c0_g1_i1.p3  ORF type:complete len:121 (+),score=44.11 TRINITY_DN7529_c0_g1_i1:85-447(+)